MRERLAATEAMLNDTAAKLRDAQTHEKYLNRVISDAKEVAGEMSVLFPANMLKANEKTSHVSIPSYRVESPIDDLYAAGAFTNLSLPVMLAHVNSSALESSVHFRVEFDGGSLGYAVTRKTLYSIPEGRLAYDISREMTRILTAEIAKAKRTMRGQRQ
jgi:hypothetical protein